MAAGLVIALLLTEIKFIEERELIRRFTDAYHKYKKKTPFLIANYFSAYKHK